MRWTATAAGRLREGLRRLSSGLEEVTRRPVTVSVMVTVSDEQRELLDASLRSIEQQRYPHVDVQVVAFGRGEGAEVATLGEARNRGAARAQGDHLLFLEASETLRPDGLAALVDRIQDSGSDLAVGGLDQEGRGSGVRHPDRTRVTLRNHPGLVADTAWGNKLFRRGFWDEVMPPLPAAGAGGLDAPVVRAYEAARSIDLVPQVVSEAADPAAGLPFGTVLTVLDGVDGWLASLAESGRLLRPNGLASARRAWLRWLFETDAIRYVDAAQSATHEQWEALRRGLAPLVAEAEAELLAGLPWESRVKIRMLSQDRREDLEDFLHLRHWEGPGHPTKVIGGRVYATVWPYQDPRAELPDDLFELTEAETPLVASLRMVRWIGAETLELDVFAFVALVGDGPEPPTLEAVLVAETGVEVPVDVERVPHPEVTRFAQERFQDHDLGGFRLRVEAAPLLGSPRWSLRLTLSTRGVTRTGTVTHRDHNGVLGERPHRLASGMLWGPSPEGPHGLVIEVARAAVVLHEAGVVGRAVRGVLDGSTGVTSVELTCPAGTVSTPVTGGRFEVELPPVGPGNIEDPEWQLRAVTAEGRRPVAYPGDVHDPWTGDHAGSLAWHRSRGGHATVHEVAHRPLVTGVELVRAAGHDDLAISLRWLGDVPRQWSLSLDGPRATLPGTPVALRGRDVEVRVPVVCDEWGLGETAAPTGIYRFVLTVGEAEDAVTLDGPAASDDLVTCTPLDLLGGSVRVRLRQTPQRRLVAHLTAPQTDDEIGPRAQRRLHEEYRRKQHVLDPDAVYLQAYTGQTATDSARAIHEHLHRHYPHLTLYWGVADHSVHLPAGAVPVVMRSREWYDLLGRATYLVSNIEFDKWFVKQPGQKFLQTFHGYPAKSMGLVQWRAKRFPERRITAELDRTMRKWDLILTPSPEMDVYYRREYAYDGPIANQGYPRDDVLVSQDADAIRRTTRERLGIEPEQKVVLYAPTFRDHLATAHRSARLAEHLDLETASEALGEEYVLLMRGHRFHTGGPHRLGRHRRLVDVTDYPEINDLILASDVAVLDYSSLRFDFALTRRPMVFLVPDLDVYSGPVRGFLFDFRRTAPGPLLEDADEVVRALRDLEGLASAYREEVETFLETYQRWQDGQATERVVRAFFGDPSVPPR